MVFRIVIEIVKVDGIVPNALILKGYRLSRYGAVAFILNDIHSSEINRILDPIVPTIRLDIPGVKYIGINAHDDVKDAISSAKMIITRSRMFGDMVNHMHSSPGHNSWPPGRQMSARNDFEDHSTGRRHPDPGALHIHRAAFPMPKPAMKTTGTETLATARAAQRPTSLQPGGPLQRPVSAKSAPSSRL